MNAVVAFALRQRVLMVVMLVAMLGAGIAGFLNLNIEAYPDPVPPLVDVVTQSTGQSAEEIERYITIPLEIQMAGIPNVHTIRTISLFGLSDVKVQFTYDFTYQQAEQWVTNRLSQLAALLDPVTHRLPVRADIDNPDGALKPEMFANFRILTGDVAQSPAVPAAAVVYEGSAAHVWVVTGEGLLAYRAIRTGRSDAGLTEVLDGLKPGEHIVTKGGLFIDQVAVPTSS